MQVSVVWPRFRNRRLPACDALIEEAWERKHRRQRRRAAVAVFVLLVAAAVGIRAYHARGSTARGFAPVASSTAALPNPCGLISVAQVRALFGTAVASITPQGNRLERSCTWTGTNMSPSDAMPARRGLMIFVRHSTKAAFINDAKHVRGAIRVTGIGDVAWTARPAVSLNVYAQGYAIEFIASLTGSALTTEKGAAAIAVKDLK